MPVLLAGSCPPMKEVLGLSRQCGLVYGILYESAFRDIRLDEKFPYNRKLTCGGCSYWSVKGLADACHLGKSSVIDALKKLLDAGFIQYAGIIWGEKGYRRRWRVTHPGDLAAVRHAISVLGLPSLKYHDPTTEELTDDEDESQARKAWKTDLHGNVWCEDDRARGDYEMERDAEIDGCLGEGEACVSVVD